MIDESAIEATNLTVDFGQGPVLDAIDFTVKRGEVVAIMGLSGGGKSTLMRAICGLQIPTSGRVSICGTELKENIRAIRLQMGMVFQSSALFDYLTVMQNVAFAIQRRGSKEQRKNLNSLVHELLETVGMDAQEDGGKFPGEISGGMKKRVGIARALALSPQIMLYDEPTTGLDPLSTEVIDGLIREINEKKHTTTVMVSHDVASCCRTAHKIWFLENGKFTFNGTPQEFLNSGNESIQRMIHSVSISNPQ